MKMFFSFFSFIVLLIVYLSGLFIQEMSNKSIFFGVRVPVGYEKKEELLRFRKEYKKNFSISFFILTAVFIAIMQVVHYEVIIFLSIAIALAGVAVLNINYYIIHKKVKQVKKSEGWKFENNKVVVVDTNYRRKDSNNKSVVVSAWWFLLPVAMIIISLIMVLANYQSLPDKIPTHFNAAGQPDSWTDKGYLPALTVVIIQSVLTFFMYVVYKFVEKAKQSLNGGEVGNIKKISRRKRYLISMLLVVTTILLNINFFLTSLATLEIIKLSGLTFYITTIAMVLLPLVFVIVAVVSARKEEGEASLETTEDGKLIINRDDDDYYWMGTWYYNKNDPALFVEKRVGFGMDFNYARPVAKIVMVIVALLIIGTFVLISSIPGMTKGRDVNVTDSSIKVSGVWGLTVNEDEIQEINLDDKLPKVLLKTNGADIGNKLFGKHKLEGYSNAVLFIEDKTKPFIAIYTKDGRYIAINYEDERRTQELLEELGKNIDVK